MEVFINDFSAYASTFELYFENLAKVLHRCEEVNLELHCEKCYFRVQEGIVLGHIIFHRGIELDRVKIEVITQVLPSTLIKGIRGFLSHVGFYRGFIQDFPKIVKTLT